MLLYEMWTPLAIFQQYDLVCHGTATWSFTQNFKLKFRLSYEAGRE